MPELLQVVDENVEVSEILKHTKLKPIYFSKKDIWSKNQYNHFVLMSNLNFDNENHKFSNYERIYVRILSILWRLRNYWFIKKIKSNNKGV